MDYINKVRLQFLENQKKVEEGKLVGFPWFEAYPRLGQFIPVLPPAVQVMFTAGSGIGKSHSWVGLILLTLYRLKKKYPDREFKIRFLISLLEDSKEDFTTRLFSALLLLKYGIRADGLDLNSRRGVPLSKGVSSKLEDVQSEIEQLLSEHCEILDSVYNPTGLYKWGRAISHKLGTHHNKELDFHEEGQVVKREVYSHYEPHDPDEQVIWVVDNLNNLSPEKNENRLETINKWTRTYARLQVTKHWKWTVVNILQQSADSEKPQYNARGELVVDRCKPSLEGLGNSKECQRDHILIFGLFAPDRFGIREYAKYDIDRIGDSFRSIIILKSNISACNIEIPMYFDGSSSVFKELPLLDGMAPAQVSTIHDKIIKRDIKTEL